MALRRIIFLFSFFVQQLSAQDAGDRVEYVSFEVSRLENTEISINWTTAREHNTKHFEIQRSLNKISWERVEKLEAAGRSAKYISYEVIDHYPYKVSSYYRLLSQNYNGAETIVPEVDLTGSASQQPFEYYPNPVTGMLTVTGTGAELDALEMYDRSGKKIDLEELSYQVSEMKIIFDLSSLPNGIYLMRSGNQTSKIIKQSES